MSEKTKQVIWLQKLIALIICCLSLLFLCIPTLTKTVRVSSDNAEYYRNYLSHATTANLLLAKDEDVLEEVNDCAELLQKSLEKDEDGNSVGFEMDLNFFHLLVHTPNVIRMAKNMTLVEDAQGSVSLTSTQEAIEKLETEDFSEVDLDAFKILCWLQFGEIAYSIPRMMGAALFLIFGLIIALTCVTAIVQYILYYVKEEKNEVVSYQSIVGTAVFSPSFCLLCAIFLDVSIFNIGAFSLTDLNALPIVIILLQCIGLLTCSIASYFKVNTPAQVKYLTSKWAINAGASICNVLLFVAILSYYKTQASSQYIQSLLRYVIVFALPFELPKALYSGTLFSYDSPYRKKELSSSQQKLVNRKDGKLDISNCVYCAIFVLLPLFSSMKAASANPDFWSETLGSIIFIVVPLMLRVFIGVIAPRLQKNIQISALEKRRLLYGVPDDDYVEPALPELKLDLGAQNAPEPLPPLPPLPPRNPDDVE